MDTQVKDWIQSNNPFKSNGVPDSSYHYWKAGAESMASYFDSNLPKSTLYRIAYIINSHYGFVDFPQDMADIIEENLHRNQSSTL